MTKKSIFMLIPAIMLLVAACKKNDNSTPVVHYTRIFGAYDDSGHTNTIYLYSPTQLIEGSYDSAKHHDIFHYSNGQSLDEVQLNGSLAYTVYYIWNSQSLVDSSNILSPSNGVGIRKKYTYDGNGFLTGVKWYNNYNALVLNESYSIANGNVTQHSYNVLDSSNTSLPGGTYTYTYYTGQKNTLSNLYFGRPYLGSSSANPVQTSTYTNGVITSTAHYTYTYSGGNIATELIFADSAGVSTTRIDSMSFNYYTQ